MTVQADGQTPLHLASENGHVDTVATLADAGAAVNQARVSVDGGTIGMFARVRCEGAGLGVSMFCVVCVARGCDAGGWVDASD